MFEDIKGVIIIRLTKDRLYNGQKKKRTKVQWSPKQYTEN